MEQQKAHGEPIGYSDNNNVPIKDGDYMKVRHGCNCRHCEHYEKVQILWNEEWKAYGMKTSDNRWIGKPALGGFLISKLFSSTSDKKIN